MATVWVTMRCRARAEFALLDKEPPDRRCLTQVRFTTWSQGIVGVVGTFLTVNAISSY